MCVLLICLLILFNFVRPITAINEDLGRHILLGKIIAETHTVPQTNMLSYTNPTYPFINSHWLSEVIFYLIYQSSGFVGLLIFTTWITIATLALIGTFIYKRYGVVPIIITACLYLPLLFERTDIRPELFSYFFVAIFVTMLYDYRKHFTKKILLLIPLQILWVNLHIYFFVGLLLLVLFLIDQCFINKFRLTKAVTLLGFVFLGSCLATTLNPNGIQGALFPITVFHNYSFPIAENQNILTLITVYRQPSFIFFLTSVFFLFLMRFITRRQSALIDWLLAITFTSLTCFAFRNVSLFFYATLIPFTAALSLLLPQIVQVLKQLVGKKYTVILTNYVLFILCLVILSQLAKTIPQKGFGFGVDERGNSAATFLLKNKLQEPLYNNFDVGSYLSYRIYPRQVFVDGRPEAYPKTFFEKTYLPMQKDPKIFKEVAKQYQFKTLFISHWDQTPWKNKLLINLLYDQHYALVYLDDYALIIVKKTNTNKDFVTRYAITAETFTIPKDTNKDALVRYLFFFEKVGWEKQKQIVSKQLEKIDPANRTRNRYQNALQKH